MSNIITPSIVYLTIDCEFTEEGLVRELVLLLHKNTQIVRALEVFISPSGSGAIYYNPMQVNYHLSSPDYLNACIDGFLESCLIYAPLKDIRLVGMSLDHDLKSLLNTTKKKSLLNTIEQKTQLELCGRGTLEDKAKAYQISSTQISNIIVKLTTQKHASHYKYHTALYDAAVTGYVYLKVLTPTNLMGVHNRFKRCTHTYYKAYYDDLVKLSQKKKLKPKKEPISPEEKLNILPKNYPEIRYKVQKHLSHVFDVVAREMFYHKISKLQYEPSLKKIGYLKADIVKQIHPVRLAVAAYDIGTQLTDPYNISLVKAGILLVRKKITLEEFVDFAIYMQQYNLSNNTGHYYKVWDSKKEVFIRCLNPSTAKKLLHKRPYCTIEQFLRKEVPECFIETIE